MRLDFVKIFVDSTILLFKELVGPSVDVPSISMKASPVAGREVMAIIGLAGEAQAGSQLDRRACVDGHWKRHFEDQRPGHAA